LLLTAGVDVQHDRLAVIIRAWGRGEESWLVYWGELPGSTLVAGAGAWVDLDALLGRTFLHASGAAMKISAVSIDGSDGNRTEVVNAYVRPRRHLGFMSVKGASEVGNDRKEIFSSAPRVVDAGKQQKAAKFGLKAHIVGTTRAKDLILETRVKLSGSGPGRMHWYASVRPDYWEQLTSEVKAPSKTNRNRKTWQKKGGARNEALDGEVYSLHAARSLKTNLLTEAHWAAIENRLRQRQLIAMEEPAVADEDEGEITTPKAGEGDLPKEATDKPAPGTRETVPAIVQTSAQEHSSKNQRKRKRTSGRGGYSVTNW
jgi:phage terminase large subunit GpA-like protein